MEELGTDLVLVSSNVSPESLGERDRIVDDFRELGDRAAARGLRVGFEALAWGRHIQDHRQAWEIVREVDHPAVGLVLDSFSSLARNVPIDSLRSIDPREAVPRPARRCAVAVDGSRCRGAVISAACRGRATCRWWSTWRRCGEIGYQRRALARDLQRPLPRRLGGGHCGRRHALAHVLAGAGVTRSTARTDRRVRCQRVEFIEFCANEEEATQLGHMLQTLGFAPTDRHRRKAVTRWRQGDINLIVNCEPEGFAHSYDTVHGASVCAIGVRVADPLGGAASGPGGCRSAASRSRSGPASSRFRPCAASAAASSISLRTPTWTRSGGPSSSRCRASAPPPMPGCGASTTSRSRCSTKRCCRGCSTTWRSSRWTRARRPRSRTRSGWC